MVGQFSINYPESNNYTIKLNQVYKNIVKVSLISSILISSVIFTGNPKETLVTFTVFITTSFKHYKTNNQENKIIIYVEQSKQCFRYKIEVIRNLFA